MTCNATASTTRCAYRLLPIGENLRHAGTLDNADYSVLDQEVLATVVLVLRRQLVQRREDVEGVGFAGVEDEVAGRFGEEVD